MALNLIGLCLMLESILGKFLVVGFLKRLGMGIRIFIVFCFLKKKSSRYLGTKKDNSEFAKRAYLVQGGEATLTQKPLVRWVGDCPI